MAIDEGFSVAPPTAVPSSGLDLAKIASGRVVEARVASLAEGLAIVEDDDAALGKRQARRDAQPFGEHGHLVSPAVAVGVLEGTRVNLVNDRIGPPRIWGGTVGADGIWNYCAL